MTDAIALSVGEGEMSVKMDFVKWESKEFDTPGDAKKWIEENASREDMVIYNHQYPTANSKNVTADVFHSAPSIISTGFDQKTLVFYRKIKGGGDIVGQTDQKGVN